MNKLIFLTILISTQALSKEEVSIQPQIAKKATISTIDNKLPGGKSLIKTIVAEMPDGELCIKHCSVTYYLENICKVKREDLEQVRKIGIISKCDNASGSEVLVCKRTECKTPEDFKAISLQK